MSRGPIRHWPFDPHFPHAAWSVATDRGLYQPGETATVFGWLRERSVRDEPSLLPPGSVETLVYRIEWPDRSGELVGQTPVSEAGSFHFSVPAPAGASAGRAQVRIDAPGPDRPDDAWQATTHLQIEEFRRPEYEVRVEGDPGVHVLGEPTEVRVDAHYFDGPPLPGAEVEWRLTASPASFRPVGWNHWHFGPDRRGGHTAVLALPQLHLAGRSPERLGQLERVRPGVPPPVRPALAHLPAAPEPGGERLRPLPRRRHL